MKTQWASCVQTVRNGVQFLSHSFFRLYTLWEQYWDKQMVATSVLWNAHNYINTVYFIHTGYGHVIQCSQTLNLFISKSGFSFVHHLRVISPQVFNRLCSFWFHLKGNWLLYKMVCLTQFRPHWTFHLGLTQVVKRYPNRQIFIKSYQVNHKTSTRFNYSLKTDLVTSTDLANYHKAGRISDKFNKSQN